MPDLAVLMGRVLLDQRVPRRLRVKLAVVLAYITSPLDILPEAVLGPLGMAEDLVLLLYAINKTLTEVDQRILLEHWSGRPGLLDSLREFSRVLGGMFGERSEPRLDRWFREEEERSERIRREELEQGLSGERRARPAGEPAAPRAERRPQDVPGSGFGL